MTRHALRLALVASVIMLLSPIAARSAPPADDAGFPARALPESAGINAQFLYGLYGPMTEEQREASVAAIAEQGIRVARMDVSWQQVEPNAPNPVTGEHDYRWSTAIDPHVRLLARHGIRLAPIIAYSTRWSATLADGRSPPRFDSDYATYAVAVAQRYGRGGAFWTENPDLPYLPFETYEIWNEPNSGFFNWTHCGNIRAGVGGYGQGKQPERYADMFVTAYNALKEADPEAVVMVGGLVDIVNDRPNQPWLCTVGEFLGGMKIHRPDLQVDAIAIHIYEDLPAAVLQKLIAVRAVIDDLGWATDIPLYFNEAGWAVPPHGPLTDAERGAYLAEVVDRVLRSNCGVRQYVPHTWITTETDPNNHEHWFGIANKDGTVKESGAAYGEAVQTLQGEGTEAANPEIERLCPWRADPDLDGDGVDDDEDAYPADPTRQTSSLGNRPSS